MWPGRSSRGREVEGSPWRERESTHRISRLVVPLRSGNSWMSVAPFNDLQTEKTGSGGVGQACQHVCSQQQSAPAQGLYLLGNMSFPPREASQASSVEWTEVPTSQIGMGRKWNGNLGGKRAWGRFSCVEGSHSSLQNNPWKPFFFFFFFLSGALGLELDELGKETKDFLQAKHENGTIVGAPGSCAQGTGEAA